MTFYINQYSYENLEDEEIPEVLKPLEVIKNRLLALMRRIYKYVVCTDAKDI